MLYGQILASHGLASIALLAQQDRQWSRGWGALSRVGTINLTESLAPFAEECAPFLTANRGSRALKVTLHDEIGHYFSFPLISETRTWKEMMRIAQVQFANRFDFDPNQYQIAVDVSQDNDCVCFAAPKLVIEGWQQVARRARVRFLGCAPHFARRINAIRKTLRARQWVAVLGEAGLALGRIEERGLRGVRVHKLKLSEGTIESCISRDQLFYPIRANDAQQSATTLHVLGTSSQLEHLPISSENLKIIATRISASSHSPAFGHIEIAPSLTIAECIALAGSVK